MALPTTFIAVTNATGAQLDNNFNAVGKIGALPCGVSGSNSITMTPTAGITPTISAYANYLMFSGIVATTNSTATQLRVGGLALLNCYKDTSAGVVALSGGELIIGNAFTAMYDSALNAGSGGFHIYTGTTFNGGAITSNLTVSGASIIVSGGGASVTLSPTALAGNSLALNGVSASLAGNVTLSSVVGVGGSLTGVLNAASVNAPNGSVATLLGTTHSLTGLFSGTSVSLTGPFAGTTINGSSGSITGVQAVASLTAGSLASVTKLMVGASASSITRLISGFATVSYSITVASGVQDQSFALAGSQVNDSLSLGLPISIPAGAGFTGFFSAAGTVTLRLINPTTVTLGAATITVQATAIGTT